jgi:transcriptional regulator with XRE-family HTH domain
MIYWPLTMNTASIGRTVQWARRRAGMTQHDLARALDMPQPSIARIERGTVTPRTATLIAILEVTGHRLAVEPIGPIIDHAPIQRQLTMNVPKRVRQALGEVAANRQESPLHILSRLRRFGIDFVLIGDVAEIVHGAPLTAGRHVEIVHAQTDVARERLAMALEDLGATTAKDGKHTTDAGELSVRTQTAAGDGYEVLVRNAARAYVDSGINVRVAAIEDLIRDRLARSTPHDEEAARVLRAVADELPTAPVLAG